MTVAKQKWGHLDHLPVGGDCYFGAFSSREEAIADGRMTYGEGATFYIASGMSPAPESLMPDADDLLEILKERAWDVGREAAEDFPGLSGQALAELNELLEAWAKKHLDVSFWVMRGEAEKIEPGA